MPVIETQSDNARHAAALAMAAREAGEYALKMFRGKIRSWTKEADSPVSEVDIAVDDLLRARLSAPGIGWLSEESRDDRSRMTAERVFIVDPIDGTRAYLAGKPDWSISAALVEAGRPIAAAVYAPVDDEMFVAAAGEGARRNGIPIRANAGGDLPGSMVAGPRGFLDRLAKIAPGIEMSPKIHSLALRITRVAQGHVDAAFASHNARDWDLAAADLLVHEAGGTMTTLAGEPLVYNLHNPVHGALLAAGRARHAAMMDVIRRSRETFK